MKKLMMASMVTAALLLPVYGWPSSWSRTETSELGYLFQGDTKTQSDILVNWRSNDGLSSEQTFKVTVPANSEMDVEVKCTAGSSILHTQVTPWNLGFTDSSVSLPATGWKKVGTARTGSSSTDFYVSMYWEVSPWASGHYSTDVDLQLTCRSSGGSSKYALCVGINSYTLSGCSTLRGCVNDAGYFRDNLVNRGGWLSSNVTKLTDGEATKTAIRNAIQAYAAKAVSGDTFIYQHSSHGGSATDSSGAYTKDVCLCTYNEEYWDYELASDLARFASGVKVVVIADTCHSGGLFKGMGKTGKGMGKSEVKDLSFDIAARVSALIDSQREKESQTGDKAASKGISSSEIGWATAAEYDKTSSDGACYDGTLWMQDFFAYGYNSPYGGFRCGGAFMAALTWGWWTGQADSTGSSAGNGNGSMDAYEGFSYAKSVLNDIGLNPPVCLNTSVLRSVALGTNGGFPTSPNLSVRDWTDSGSSSTITLEWSGARNATSYKVYRSTTPGSRPSSPIATGITSSPYTDDSSVLSTGERYYYWVEAVNASGSAFSCADYGYTCNSVVPLSTALDNTSLPFTTGGGGSWWGLSGGISHDGADAAQSGKIGNNQGTWLETTVSGAGTLSFWWKVSCENDNGWYDYLEVLVDEVQKQRIKGETDWTQVNLSITGSGSHKVKWNFRKDDSNLSGSDCGWVDQVTWTPANSPSFTIEDGVLKKVVLNGCTEVTIPDSVTSIGYRAFEDCENGLISVTIPDSVTIIEQEAFTYCHRLRSVTIPDSVTIIGHSAFAYCSGLTSVTIGNGVKDIRNYAFERCSGLVSVTIPNSVTNIGIQAFYMCSGLTSMKIPDSVTRIRDGAFAGCSGLESFVVASGNMNYKTVCGLLLTKDGKTLVAVTGGLTSLTIPDGVTSIGAGAVRSYVDLAKVTIPNSVTNIGEFAFAYCSGLTSVTIPDSVNSIEFAAFDGCSSLTEVSLPGALKDKISENSVFGERYSSIKIVYRSSGGEIWTVKCHKNDPNGGEDVTRSQNIAVGETKRLLYLDSALKWSIKDVDGFSYIFLGWAKSKTGAPVYANGEQVCDLVAAGKVMHLYAVWQKRAYQVVFHSNDGANKTVSQEFRPNIAKNLLWLDSGLGWTRSGYDFLGWSLNPTSTAVVYTNGQNVKDLLAIGEKLHLYAVWRDRRWTIRYHRNYSSTDGEYADQKIPVGASVKLLWLDSQLGWTRSGYWFKGWAKSRTGGAVYQNGQTVKDLVPGGQVLHVYGAWGKKSN